MDLKYNTMNETVKKNGLVLSSDMKILYGIDTSSSEFAGNVPYGVERIEEDAFSCSELTEIILPETVKEVGANLFCNSKNLVHVKLPSGLKNLSPFMFCGCTSLQRIDMPLEVTEFPEGLFAECTSLEEIPFRAGLKVLPEGVFAGCASLKSLVIPGTVQKICANAITDCTDLRTIVLPEELKDISSDAIANCPSLTRIRISEDNPHFYTDEEGVVLYRRKLDGEGTKIFEVGNKTRSQAASFNEDLISEIENPSIVNYDDEEDNTEDELDLFSAGKEPVAIINGDDDIKSIGDEKVLEENSMSSDMESRLAEIMSQDYKQYGEGDFNIMSIPAASDEEIEASRLAPSEADPDFVPSMEIPKPVVHQAVETTPESMEDRIAEIMKQETYNFSIGDIPMASEEEIGANRLVSEGDFALGVESADSAIPEVPEAELNKQKNYDDTEKAVMNNLVFESDKVEQVNLIPEADEQKILFVFAQNLANGPIGKIFSKRLVKCANRLAEIHKYTSIYFFSGVDMDNEKFKVQFTSYIKDKSVVIACGAGTLGTLDNHTIEFAKCCAVPLEKDKLDEQVRIARMPGASCLKLLIQDNLAD